MNFPTLHCRCLKGHTWATLIPSYWFKLKDMACPHCDEPAVDMKAGDWKTLEEIKQAQA